MEAILRGRLGADPQTRAVGDHTVAVLRVAEQQHAKERERGDTVLWVDVEAWGQLGERCIDTLTKGTPVLIHGRWTAAEWTGKDGKRRYKTSIKAYSVAVDLGHPGTTVTVQRTERAHPASTPDGDADSSSRPATPPDPFDEE